MNEPNTGSLDSIAVWNFNNLPVDVLEISYIPKISAFAGLMVNIGPTKLSFSVFMVLAILHLLYLLSYRRKNIEKQYSWVMIAGSFLIPALGIIFYLVSFPLIDYFIGDPASERHGYYFIMIFAYPIIMPLYLIAFWLTDRIYKRKLLRKNLSDD